MNKFNLYGWIFLAGCGAMIVSAFLPYVTLTAYYGDGESATVTPSLLAGPGCFLAILIAAMGILLLFLGKKNRTFIISILAAVLTVAEPIKDQINISKMENNSVIMREFSGVVSNRIIEYSIKDVYLPGFYLMLLGGIVVLIAGFLYTFSEE